MKASIVDLRYKMKEVLAAIDRNETVEVYYRGKLKATMNPIVPPKKKKFRIMDSPIFGARKDDPRTVAEIMRDLRRPRYDHVGHRRIN
jgi:hypothetical protein